MAAGLLCVPGAACLVLGAWCSNLGQRHLSPTAPHPRPHRPPTRAQVRPYLMADGGNVEFVEIDGPVVYLRLAGACGSCPSSLTTMTMGIKRRLMERIPVSWGRGAGWGTWQGGTGPAVPSHRTLPHPAADERPLSTWRPPCRTFWRWSR